MRKRILFYVPGLDVIKNGVYYSQVFGLARYLVGEGAQCMIVHTYYGDNVYGERTVEGVALLNCPQDSKYVPLPFLPWKLRRSVRPAEKRIREFAPTHVYIRDAFQGVAAFGLVKELGAKIVYSCRGAGMAEGYTSVKEYVKEGILRINMWRLTRRSSHVNAVCEGLRDHMLRLYYKGPTSVLPCCVMDEKFAVVPDAEKARIRRELNIPAEAKVVAYSGGMGWYQCTDELLTLFKRIHEVDDRIVFLILTQSQDFLRNKLKEIGLPEDCLRTRSCKPTEVSAYLQTADVGVILRKNDTLNQLASPVKIGEYLSSGLAIVVSPWIGDVGRLLYNADFAFLHADGSEPESIVQFVKAVNSDKREHARRFARTYYTYEGNRQVVHEMFNNLK